MPAPPNSPIEPSRPDELRRIPRNAADRGVLSKERYNARPRAIPTIGAYVPSKEGGVERRSYLRIAIIDTHFPAEARQAIPAA